jgi:hypothetical protein
MFGDAEDAAAFMLGKLLLAPGGRLTEAHEQSEPAEEAPQPSVLATPSPEVATGSPAGHAAEEQPRAETARPESPIRDGLDDELQKTTLGLQRIEDSQPAAPPRREPPAPTVAVPPLSQPVTPPGPPVAPPAQPATPPRREEPGRPVFAQGDQRPGSGGQQWPIYPMAGEPPLTLFRGKELRELPAGSELDRFGGPNGNLTYAAGTPFEERSLVPEWVNRPYHVYRVQRPIEALSGVAIPWFNQPGGGAAYLLPASIEELVADGNLLELDPGDPPID